MKKLLTALFVVALLSVPLFGGTTLGFLLQPNPGTLSLELVPLVLGVQYEGQYGFGTGVEVYKTPFDFNLVGTYWIHEFLTVDLTDRQFLEAGVLQSIELVDLDPDPGVGVEVRLWGNIGYGLGIQGHSVRLDLLYAFSDLTELRLRLGARLDLFGLYRQASELWAKDEDEEISVEVGQ